MLRQRIIENFVRKGGNPRLGFTQLKSHFSKFYNKLAMYIILEIYFLKLVAGTKGFLFILVSLTYYN